MMSLYKARRTPRSDFDDTEPTSTEIKTRSTVIHKAHNNTSNVTQTTSPHIEPTHQSSKPHTSVIAHANTLTVVEEPRQGQPRHPEP